LLALELLLAALLGELALLEPPLGAVLEPGQPLGLLALLAQLLAIEAIVAAGLALDHRMPLDVAIANPGLALDALPLDTLRALALDALLPLDALPLDPLGALALDALLPLDALGPDALDVPRAPLDDPLLALRPRNADTLLALRALHAHALLALRTLHAHALLALRLLRPRPLRTLGLTGLGLLGALLAFIRLGLGGGGDCKRRDGRDQKSFGHRKNLACLDSGHFGEIRLITI
jgi:hypothetical protein